METFRKFELTLFSAKDLDNPRLFLDAEVYAKVSIGGKVVGETERKKTEKKTKVDTKGGRNPSWNHNMVFVAKEATIHNADTVLRIRLYCVRSVVGRTCVGEVKLRLKDLFDQRTPSAEIRTYEVCKCKIGGQGASGTLDMSYSFGEPILADEEAVSAGNAEDQVRPGMVTLKKAGKVVLVGVKVALAVGMIILDIV